MDPWVYKPLGCSLWPLAIFDYEDDDGEDRLLLTIYARATEGLFESESDDDSPDEGEFACLVDKDPEYDPMYRSCKERHRARVRRRLLSQARHRGAEAFSA